MQLEDIKKLAGIARIDMSTEEMQEILDTFPSILAYIDQINELPLEKIESVYDNTNIFRDDIVTNENGVYRDVIIAQMPDKKDGYLKVKQIL
jgi:aspartyl-tRNA(Asn)/glutamyl-tRNA(Gln) amidotransferase subunit C